jgi:hypothetical protein
MERSQSVFERGVEATPVIRNNPFFSAFREIRGEVRERFRFLEPFSKLSFLSPEQRKLLGQLFPHGLPSHLEQSPDVGDCYFVAALYALEQNSMAPHIFAESIEKAPNGFRVKFLGDYAHPRGIFINNHSDLDGQEVLDKRGRREYKQPITGQLGDIILERAFARQRKEERNAFAPTQARELTMTAAEGGLCEEPLKMLLGEKAEMTVIGYSNPLANHPRDRSDAEKLLMQFGIRPHRFIVTACTPSSFPTKFFRDGYHREFGEGRKYFMDPERFFYQHHAFAVISVSPTKRTVTVVNPHDTAHRRKTISFEDFFRYFSRIEAAELRETAADHRIIKERNLEDRQKDAAHKLARKLFPAQAAQVRRVNDSIFNIIDRDERYIGYSLMVGVDTFDAEVGGRVQLIKMESSGGSWKGTIIWEKSLDDL